MTLFFKENINICFANNENISYRKSYIPCYILEVILTDSYNFAKGN